MTFPFSITIENRDYKQDYRPVFKVPSSGTFMQLRHDFETADWDFKPRAYTLGTSKLNPYGAYPDTVPLDGIRPDDFYPLNEQYQRLWFNMMDRASNYNIPHDDLIDKWAVITSDGRALTDKHTWNWAKAGEPKLFTDYIQRLNLNSEYGDMQQKSLSMGGNIVKIIGTYNDYFIIETIDITETTPPILNDIWGKHWLVHWGTQSSIRTYGDTWQITDWSWLNWNDVSYGVPFMLIGIDGKNLVKKNWCKPIQNGTSFSPYIPPMR